MSAVASLASAKPAAELATNKDIPPTVKLLIGGSVLDRKLIEPEEIRANNINGGESRKISKGDVIVIPHGTPHWFKEVNGPINYYVVKVRSAD